MMFKLLQEMDNLLKEEEKKKDVGPKVAKTLAAKTYHRDYIRSRKKKYRIEQD